MSNLRKIYVFATNIIKQICIFLGVGCSTQDIYIYIYVYILKWYSFYNLA